MKTPYINLTSGLEYLHEVPTAKLVRIQSSHLESNALWAVIMELDYNFLFDAAIKGVILYDCWSRRGATTRAQWLGVPWIKYAYSRANGLPIEGVPPSYRGNFEKKYLHGDRVAPIKKLRYVYKMTGGELKIDCISKKSLLDGNYPALRDILYVNIVVSGLP